MSVIENFALRSGRVHVTIDIQRLIMVALFPLFLGAKALIHSFCCVEVDFKLIMKIRVVRHAVLRGVISIDGGHELDEGNEINVSFMEFAFNSVIPHPVFFASDEVVLCQSRLLMECSKPEAFRKSSKCCCATPINSAFKCHCYLSASIFDFLDV